MIFGAPLAEHDESTQQSGALQVALEWRASQNKTANSSKSILPRCFEGEVLRGSIGRFLRRPFHRFHSSNRNEAGFSVQAKQSAKRSVLD
jgi:hypothetical protein